MSKVTVEIDIDLQDLIPQFLENRRKDLIQLELLVAQNDLPSISQLAHKIKGAAAGYGFAELSEYASQMETAAKKNDASPLPDLIKKMKSHFSNIEVRFVPM